MAIKRTLVDVRYNAGVGIGIDPSGTAILNLPAGTTYATGGIMWGSDTVLYRSAAGFLRTDGTVGIGAAAAANAALNFAVSAVAAGGINFGADTNLYRSAADALTTDDLLVLPSSQNDLTKKLGLFVGNGGWSTFYQSGVNNSGDSFIGHNAYVLYNSINALDTYWQASHASFGSRGIAFRLSHGITFFADNAASTAGASFATTERMRLTNDGTLLIGTVTDQAARLGFPAGTTAADGIIWGSDTNLYRSGADSLASDDQFIVKPGVAGQVRIGNGVNGEIAFGSAADTNLYRSAADILKTDDSFTVGAITGIVSAGQGMGVYLHPNGIIYANRATGAANTVFAASHNADANLRYRMWSDGRNEWGDGTAVPDTNLYRSAADILKTDDAFQAASYAVGVTALASTHLSDTLLLARLAGPAFSGVPSAPTAAVDTNTTQLATTAFVIAQAYAKLASPVFSGTPTLPTGTIATTQAALDSSTKLATTAFVTTANNLKANLASPAFTGTVTSGIINASEQITVNNPTTKGFVASGKDWGDTSLQAFYASNAAATADAFLTARSGDAVIGTTKNISLLIATNSAARMTITGAGAVSIPGTLAVTGLINGGSYQVAGVALASTHLSDTLLLARLAGPIFSGVPTAPTAAVDTNTTQLATTAFVIAQAYAKLASPVFSGTPTLPTGTIAVTQAALDSSTKVATTAFVTSADALKANLPTVIVTKSVLDVGVSGQIRAGRPLVLADFTTLLGLAAPVGLFNLDGTTNLGTGGALTNKGAVPFTAGISGTASEAAQFAGSTAQAFYIADSAGLSISAGTVGCWFRTAKGDGSIDQQLISKYGATLQRTFQCFVKTDGRLVYSISVDGTFEFTAYSTTDVCDDCWHFGVGVYDGSTVKVYVDGVLEGTAVGGGLMYDGTAPFNIGARAADAAAAVLPFFGSIDEAFITADVLSEEQIRLLYCAKIPHGAATLPTSVKVAVRRKKKGGPFVSGDFPSQPVRLHNFTAGVLTDAGSGNISLTNTGAAVSMAGADGAQGGGFNFITASTQHLNSTDAGLPATTTPRSYGCWVKTITTGVFAGVMGWGAVGTADARLIISTAGLMQSGSGVDAITGPFISDGVWHFVVAVEDNTALGTARANGEISDGVKRKLYVDGKLVGVSSVLTSLTLSGAAKFNIGANPGGTAPFTGQIDGVFVHSIALTAPQIAKLYAVGSQALLPSPKNVGDHVEAIDTTNLYTVFDSLETQQTVDMEVS